MILRGFKRLLKMNLCTKIKNYRCLTPNKSDINRGDNRREVVFNKIKSNCRRIFIMSSFNSEKIKMRFNKLKTKLDDAKC